MHDPTLRKLLRGDLLALSGLSYQVQRELILEALQDTLPAHTQRDARDPGIALIEALCAAADVFGFYHDRILTESKVGSAQLLASVTRLAEAVGYTPRPPLAATAYQFFRARREGVVPSGSKLAARPEGEGSKIVFETARSLTIAPSFNRMGLEPIIARHIGAERAVLAHLSSGAFDTVTPLDDFQASAWAMVNGHAGLELSPVDRVRRRAISLERSLRRSYDVDFTRIHCATEWRWLRAPHSLIEDDPAPGREDLVVFEVTSRPILHFPASGSVPRLVSSLALYVFDDESDPRDPSRWTEAHRWTEVADFTASEAADKHYRTIVDDRLHTYVILRRKLGHRLLLSDAELNRVYVRFIPAVGALDVPQEAPLAPLPHPADLSAHTLELSEEYYETPIIRPKVDGELISTRASHWVALERDPRLRGGRQIAIENAETGEIYVRSLSHRTIARYLSWMTLRLAPEPGVAAPDITVYEALWIRLAHTLSDIANDGDDLRPLAGLIFQDFGHYFPLNTEYPVLPGRGVERNIHEGLLFRTDIPDANAPVESWSEVQPLFVSPLRDAIGEGPYHLWDQFYRQFENLTWRLRPSFEVPFGDDEIDEDSDLAPVGDLEFKHLEEAEWLPSHVSVGSLKYTTIVPSGSTFVIVQDTSLVRPGDYFLLGKRVRRSPAKYPEEGDELPDFDAPPSEGPSLADVLAPRSLNPILPGDVVFDNPAPSGGGNEFEQAKFSPNWIVAEVLQAVEVQGKIVRLKWPTQNEYTVDFATTGEGDSTSLGEPVTELIVVPQVASVYFGDHFKQKFSISPNYAILESAYGPGGVPEPLFLAPLDPALKAKKLRSIAGWTDLDGVEPAEVQAELDKIWPDVYLAHTAHTEDVNVGPGQDGPPGDQPLHWRILIRVESDLADEDVKDIVGDNDFFILGYLKGEPLQPGIKLSGAIYVESDSQHVLVDLSVDENALTSPLVTTHESYAYRFGLPERERWTWKENFTEDAINDDWARFRLLNDGHSTEDVVVGSILEVTAKSIVPMQLDKTLRARVADTADFMGYRRVDVVYEEDPPEEYHKGFNDPILVVLKEVPASGGLQAHVLLSSSEAEPPLLVPAPIFEEDPEVALTDHGVIPTKTPFPQRFLVDAIPASHDLFDDIITAHTSEPPVAPPVMASWKALPNQRDALDKARLAESDDELIMSYNFLRANSLDALMVTGQGALGAGLISLFSREAGPKDAQAITISEAVQFVGTVLTESIIFNSANFIPVRLGDREHDHEIVENSIEIELETVGLASFGKQPVEYEGKGEEGDTLVELLDKVLSGQANDFSSPLYKWGFNKTPDGTFTINFLFVGWFPSDTAQAEVSIKVFYTAAPYQGGTKKDPSLWRATYMICPNEYVTWFEDRFYEFETRPLPWNPLRQLVIMNAGDLKAGDYLFVNPSNEDEEHGLVCGGDDIQLPPVPLPPEFDEASELRDYIQWTRIVEVDGRMVMVDPPLKIQPRGFFHYRVSGYRRPPGAQNPYEHFYAGLQPAEHPSSEETSESQSGERPLLRFDDRIVLRPWTLEVAAEAEDEDAEALALPLARDWHLRHLAPGDRLLLWHEAWRRGWFSHRRGEDAGEPWFEWPDYQHEVVIKKIDHDLGLIEFERPMPERFGIRYEKESSDFAEHTVFPFYREPFQGERVLTPLGDGDRRIKFARYHGTIDLTFGLASIALPAAGTVASNVEVFTIDGRTEEWLRWTEFRSLESAKRKDLSFVLGLEQQGIRGIDECDAYIDEPELEDPPRECCCDRDGDGADDAPDRGEPRPRGEERTTPFTVSFGDGVNGQIPPTGRENVRVRVVDVGRWCRHFPEREVRLMTAVRRACLPVRVESHLASPENLAITAEHGAHHHWRPRAGVKGWEPSLVVAIKLADLDPSDFKSPELIEDLLEELDPAKHADGVLYLREVSEEEAAEGKDGLIVRPLRPGVVDIFVALKQDLTPLIEGEFTKYVTVYEELRAPLWRLDEGFYQEALDHDPTLHTGSRRVLLADTEGLSEGSLLGFKSSEDEEGEAEIGRVESVSHATFSAWLEEGLTRTYDLDRSFLFGNTVEAVQGDSDRQVIGSGDGVTPNLRLPLPRRRPLLYSTLGSRVSGALTPGVTVLVDDQPWELVDTFDGRGPRDRVFVLETEANGDSWICFGDGRQGAVPRPGIDNITAVTRSGDGGGGNVALGAINRLLDGNLAVDKTHNVTAGVGGRPADNVDDVREHLMTRDFTHGRVVTRDDLVKALLSLTDAVQVRLDPLAEDPRIRVYVALAGRRRASPLMLEEFVARVGALMPAGAGVGVELANAEHTPVHVGVELTVTAGHNESDVIQRVERSFSADEGGFFDLERWPIGAPLHVGEIYERIFLDPGVATARVRWLSRAVEPMELPEDTPDSLSPGYFGVIRCDSDRATDYARSNGNFHVWVKRGRR